MTRNRRPTSITLMKDRFLEEENKQDGMSDLSQISIGHGRSPGKIFAYILPVVLIRVQGLVAGFVTFNSPLEVQHGISFVAVTVIWTRHLHFLEREEECHMEIHTSLMPESY